MMPVREKQPADLDLAKQFPSTRDPIGSWLDVLERMLHLPHDQKRAIRAELEDHLRNRVDDLMMTGMSEPEATRVAVGELGETAELASSFRSAATAGKRLTMIQATAIATVGGIVTFGLATLLTPLQQQPMGAGGAGAGGVGAAEAKAPLVALDENPGDAFDANLRCYDLTGMIDARTPLSHNPAAQQIVDVLESIAFNEEAVDDDVPFVEPRMMIVGSTLFVRADEAFHKRAAWVLSSIKQKALEQQKRDDRMLAAQRERERLERERAENERCQRIDELRAMYAKLTDQLREQLDQREARVAAYEQAMREANQDKLAQQSLMRRFSVKTDLFTLEQEDLHNRIHRVREMLMDAEYGQSQPVFGASTGRARGGVAGGYDPFGNVSNAYGAVAEPSSGAPGGGFGNGTYATPPSKATPRGGAGSRNGRR